MVRESHTNCVSPCYPTSFHAEIFFFVSFVTYLFIFFCCWEDDFFSSSFLHLILSRFPKNRLLSSWVCSFRFPGGDHPSSLTVVDDDDSRVAGGGAGLKERYAKDNSHDFLFSPFSTQINLKKKIVILTRSRNAPDQENPKWTNERETSKRPLIIITLTQFSE